MFTKRWTLCLILLTSDVLAADFGDIPANLTMPAGQAVRRNAGNSAFEAYIALTLPVGGNTNYVLAKASGADYDVAWKSPGFGVSLVGDVTGTGPSPITTTIANDAVTYAKMQNVSAASKLLGRGSTAGAGDPEEITLGTNLSMSGTTLNATGGGGTPGGSNFQVQFNDGGAFGGDSGLTWDKTNDRLYLNPGTDQQTTFTVRNAAGNPAVQIGTYPSFPQYAGMWFGNLSPSGSNFGFIGDATNETIMNGPGRISLRINGTNDALELFTTKVVTGSEILFGWSSGFSTALPLAALDTALARNAAGVVEINNGTAGQYRDLRLRKATADDGGGLYFSGGSNGLTSQASYPAMDVSGILRMYWATEVRMPAGQLFGWTSSTVGFGLDTGMTRNAAGVVEINNGTAGTYRDLNLRNLNIQLGGAASGSGTVPTGGSTGQVLNKNSGTNYDVAWATLPVPYGGSITGHGNTDYNILSTDRFVYTNAAFTAARNWFLPLANSVPAGTSITIADWQKTLTISNYIAINRSGTDTIGPLASGTTVYMLTQGESITLLSDGSSRWFFTNVTGGTAVTGRFMQGSINGDSSWSQSQYALPLTMASNSGSLLRSNGTDVGFTVATYPTTSGGVGYTPRSDGTNFVSYPQDILNSSTADLTVSTSDIYLTGSNCGVTAGDFKAKGQYKCFFDMAKTAGTGAIVITVRVGTTGSTSDTTATMTFTFGAGTSVSDTGSFEVYVNWRSVGGGTSAVLSGYCVGRHNLATTGMFNNASSFTIVGTTTSGFNSTGASQIGVSFNGSTAFAGTNKVVQATLTQ